MSCGSTLKLQHSSLSTFLHSHEVQYGSGSGQQSVTGALFAMHVACSAELLSYPAIEQVHGSHLRRLLRLAGVLLCCLTRFCCGHIAESRFQCVCSLGARMPSNS